jgi:hypothetical protein
MMLAIAFLVFLAFAILVLLQWRKAEIARRAEAARERLVERLVERFGDSEDFRAFAESPEGRRLLGARDAAAETGRRLIAALQAAVLLAALGAAFFATALSTPAHADINLVREAEEARYWGTFCVALAAGLAVASWVGQERARAWGLLPK